MKKNLIGLLITTGLLVSCTSSKKSNLAVDNIFGTKEFAESLVSGVTAGWFKQNKDFQLRSYKGEVSTHMLFDTKPDIDKEKSTLNFIVETPEGSDHGYKVDLTTGQHYFTKKFCTQKDVWDQFDRPINKANFTTGIVPRVLDQLGEPQKIIVFGGRDYYISHFKTNYYDARVIGGYIEQVCPYGGCLNKGDWKSKLVLIGVQTAHKDYKDINNFNELQKIVDIEYVKAAIENVNGANKISDVYYPAFRMGGIVSGSQALDFLDRNSIFLTQEKTSKIQRSCFKLYDSIWDKISKKSKYEIAVERLNRDRTVNVREYTKRLSLIKKLPKDLFYKRFIRGFKDFERDYKTCIKYVYPSNLNVDLDKHWFFTYYTAVNLLHGLHYSYDCNRKVWAKNPKTASGKRYIELGKEFRGCSSTDIDTAFSRAVIFLKNLADKGHESYRYVDYDTGASGSHSKVYSWVKQDNKKMNCEESSQANKSLYNNFPKDIKWNKRSLKSKLGKGLFL